MSNAHTMRTRGPLFVVVLLLGVSAPRVAIAQEDTAPSREPAEASFFTVAEYDPARDPVKDLEATVQRAQAEGKRILLDVGGEWCAWCHALDAYIQENEAVHDALQQHFLIMKVNYSQENDNQAFLSKYPGISGYPHLFVLESDGTFLHSQGTAPLEEGVSYNEEVFLAFLKKWTSAD